MACDFPSNCGWHSGKFVGNNSVGTTGLESGVLENFEYLPLLI